MHTLPFSPHVRSIMCDGKNNQSGVRLFAILLKFCWSLAELEQMIQLQHHRNRNISICNALILTKTRKREIQ